MLIPSPGAQTKHNEMKGDTPMKKMLALILTMSLVFALLTACGGDQSGNQPNSENTGNPTTSQSGGSENSSTDFSEKVNLTFAIGGAAGQGTAIALQNAIDMISERSNGAITIELVTDGALGNEASLLAQAMEGAIDIAGCAIGTVSNYSDALSIYQMPFLINSYELEAEVLQSDAWKNLVAAANEDLGTATIVGASEFGIRHFATINRPINTMADMQGLKIRTGGNPVIDEAMQIVGASPTNVTFSELYSALQNGVVDGEEINVTSASMQKHYEVCNYMSEIGIYPWLSLTIMSNATIESLPEGYYELICECFAEADAEYMQTTIYEWDEEARADCEANGMEFNEISDKDAWVEAMQPLYDEWIARGGVYEEFITSVQEMAAAMD